MTDVPKRIWVNPDVEYADREKQYGCNIEYHRADLSADLVRAALDLETIAHVMHDADPAHRTEPWEDVQDHYRYMSNEVIAAIVAQVMEKE